MAGRPSGGRSPKRRRLSRSAEFERVYRHGRSKSNRFLVLYSFPRGEEAAGDDPAGPRLGLSVSRRVGGAVDRSRVKRVLREAFWAEAERLPEGSDYVVVARPDSRDLAEREGMSGMRSALAELVDALASHDERRRPAAQGGDVASSGAGGSGDSGDAGRRDRTDASDESHRTLSGGAGARAPRPGEASGPRTAG